MSACSLTSKFASGSASGTEYCSNLKFRGALGAEQGASGGEQAASGEQDHVVASVQEGT